jgi:hypothetical protein
MTASDDLDDGPEATSLRAAFDEAIRTAPHLPRDVAMVVLARRYADTLDDAYDRLEEASEDEEEQPRNFGRMVAIIAKIGPRYEAVLDKLGMSPGARPASRGGDPHGVDPAAAALAELQSGSSPPGLNPAAYVDAAVAEADAGD